MTNFHNIYLSVIGECATGFGSEECDLTNDALAELLSRLMDAERDAERYRWVRDEARHHMDGGPLVFMTNYDGDPVAYPECGVVLHESYLDEAIDEAMKCKQK